MDKEHHKDSHKENPDRLTNFMFGGSMSRNERKGRNDDAESSFQERKQHADDWFIGKRSHGTDKKKQGESTDEEMPILDLLNHIDMEKLAGNIDTIMSTASQFKPLIQQVSPLLKKWIK
jgi:hypothetical protein